MRRQLALRRIRERSRPLDPRPTGVKPLLRRVEGVRAVLFDVYGTLFVSASGQIGTDVADDRAKPLADAFAGLGLPLPEPAARRADRLLREIIRERHRQARADGVDFPEVDIVSVFQELLRRLNAATGTRLPGGRSTAQRLALEHELRRNPVWPMPQAVAMLAALKDRGLLLGIVSNSQFYTPWLFSALMGATMPALGFRAALCAWSYRCGCAKPSLSLLLGPLRELERRGLPPAAVLVVGNDWRNDLDPGSRLGCRTALFAGDARSFRPRAQSAPDAQGRAARVAGPDLLLTALSQLPDLVR